MANITVKVNPVTTNKVKQVAIGSSGIVYVLKR